MRHIAATLTLGFASAAIGQVAEFTPNATIQVTGNTTIVGSITFEARLRLFTDSPSVLTAGRLWTEQQADVEDKNFAVGPDGVIAGACCSPDHAASWSGPLPVMQWVHVAAVLDGTESRIYVDGVLVAAGDLQLPFLNSPGSWMAVGAGDYSTGAGTDVAAGIHGQIDWLRISTVARYYGTSFQPPTECDLSNVDTGTALLLLFNDPAGAADLIDLSLEPMAVHRVPWFAGSTVPVLGGDGLDANHDGVTDCCEAPTGCDPCPADFNGDGAVNGGDIGYLLAFWGLSAADLDGDSVVTGADLGILLAAWGPCP